MMLAPILTFAQTKSEVSQNENAVVVSATEMNVLYIGVDNPIEISVCGESCDNISATIDGGEITKVFGLKWIAKVKTAGKTKINVYIEKDGKKVLFSSKEYRVKSVPNPIAMIAGKRTGAIDKDAMLKTPYLSAILEDFLFDNVRYKIISFKISFAEGGSINEFKCTSNEISAAAITKIKTVKPDTKVFFEDIKAIGPDGTERMLDALTFTIK